MCKKVAFLMLLIMAITSSPGFATGVDDLTKENARLQKRVEQVELELLELKKELAKLHSTISSQKNVATTSQKNVAITPQKNVTTKNPVWSNLDIQIYGYVKADASYDQLRTTTGNYAVYVNPETGEKNDDEFNLTAKQTRLGMNIKGPQDDGVQASGKVEIDFYNTGAENKGAIQMRHGYLVLDWPEEQFSILAGQTSDVISPLVPSTLNYTVLWDCGNIGYRRPQIRLTKTMPLGNDSSFKAEAAIARAIGRTTPTNSESGEDSGFPNVQARTSFTFPFGGYKPTTVGFSGHWGQEEYDITGNHRTLETWSVNADVTQPISKDLTVKGEFYHGVNMNTFLGGIGQGVNTTDTSNPFEIAATGAWVAATLGPWDKWTFNLGAGIDAVKNNDVSAGNRTRNMCAFGNAIYSINKNTQIGFEVSQWETNYKGPGDAQSLRGQMSIIYKF